MDCKATAIATANSLQVCCDLKYVSVRRDSPVMWRNVKKEKKLSRMDVKKPNKRLIYRLFFLSQKEKKRATINIAWRNAVFLPCTLR